MKKTIVMCILFCGIFLTGKAQQDTGRQTKTTTRSAASYRYESSFRPEKNEAIKKYLVKELGAGTQTIASEHSWAVK